MEIKERQKYYRMLLGGRGRKGEFLEKKILKESVKNQSDYLNS